MKKIISLFQRNYDGDKLVRDEIVPGAEWVPAGEGVATRKYDGTCCLIKDGKLFKRYELKNGKTAPAGFVAAQELDAITGDCPGWLPVGDGPEDRWHREAFESCQQRDDGTYELCGPRVQGNPEGFSTHVLLRHGVDSVGANPRTFDEIRQWLESNPHVEGIVWHHPDGRMVKIKARDFGLKRKPALV